MYLRPVVFWKSMLLIHKKIWQVKEVRSIFHVKFLSEENFNWSSFMNIIFTHSIDFKLITHINYSIDYSTDFKQIIHVNFYFDYKINLQIRILSCNLFSLYKKLLKLRMRIICFIITFYYRKTWIDFQSTEFLFLSFFFSSSRYHDYLYDRML